MRNVALPVILHASLWPLVCQVIGGELTVFPQGPVMEANIKLSVCSPWHTVHERDLSAVHCSVCAGPSAPLQHACR
eukprot:6205426-Pleurochrysis_carterae.AAC.2